MTDQMKKKIRLQVLKELWSEEEKRNANAKVR
jgi:hypothetical protein